MSGARYFERAAEIMQSIRRTQSRTIERAATLFADSIAGGGWVYLFGSGHSVLPVMDVFPRYGSFLGFRPLMDPRLMWFNVTGPGGAPELLWLERQPGYIEHFLGSYPFRPTDSLLVFSHGGLNAAAIEACEFVRERGCRVVSVTCMENQRTAPARHPSGRKLSDVSDIVIDNCVPPEDALVDVGQTEKVAAGSTLGVTLISMALVAETASELKKRGLQLETFVSPNVAGVSPDHNQRVFDRYRSRVAKSEPSA